MSPGVKSFEIRLNNRPDYRYSPGETIAGRVVVEINGRKSIRSITVRIKGKGKVHWGDGYYFTGEENYLHDELYVLGRAEYSQNVEIQGYRVFPFKFCLPRNIPSSFESSYGHIRYKVKAVMDAFWRFDRKTSTSFAVETPYDLSQCTTAMIAIYDEVYRIFRRFRGCSMGVMAVKIFLPTSGFAIGEEIETRINIYNTSSSVDVTKVELRLEQIIKLRAKFSQSNTRTDTDIVQNVTAIGPFRKKGDIFVNMQVPSLPYSHMVYTTLIDIEYYVRVIISVSGYHSDIDKRYPIVIGTKPALGVSSREISPRVSPAPVPIFLPDNVRIGPPLVMGSMPMPYSLPLDEQFPEHMRDGCNASAPDFSDPVPTYSSIPGNEPYPPPIGFVIPPRTSTASGSTEEPPPSYNEAMRMIDER